MCGDGVGDGVRVRVRRWCPSLSFRCVDSSLVGERMDCFVEAFGGKRDCCWSERQATTILLITLEVANSKAKSEGIQIYCYK